MKNLLLTLILALPIMLFGQDRTVGVITNTSGAINTEGATSASFDKHELGVFLGVANSATDVHCFARFGEGILDRSSFGWGLNYTYNMSPTWGLRLSYLNAKLIGDDKFVNREGGHEARGFNYTSPLHEIAALVQWDLLGKKRYNTGVFKKTFSPYLLAGLGVSLTNPTVDWTNQSNFTTATKENIKYDQDNIKKTSLQIPLGLGFKYDLTRKLTLGLEGRTIYGLSDYLDGISKAGNEDLNDYYFFGGVNMAYRLSGKADRDNDGVADEVDNCPDIAGLESLGGCPDADGDGITDADDSCPMVAGLSTLRGCPDADGDGIADKNDDCPSIAGESRFNGCVDTDGDGIRDMDDKCPNEAGTAEYGGCAPADADGDGIADDKDMCPKVAGTVNGCPDSDGDGVADKNDRCPKVKGTLAGCPDSDGDGVSDATDRCPKVRGDAANNGCPKRKVTRTVTRPSTSTSAPISNWAKDLYFNTASSGLDKKARLDVDEIIRISKQYPGAKFMISGYTDARGGEAMNLKLSERRAKAVYSILIKRGISASRLRYAGYGEANPKVANNTKDFILNRRVEVRFIR